MPRVKRGTQKNKKRKRLLKETKGYMWHRKNKKKAAKQAWMKAMVYAFRDRRKKKGTFRKLWNTRINAEARANELSYSKFMGLLRKNNIKIDRKILSDLAQNNPKVFEKIVEKVK
jgi:large subunit ribosomal protein L20